MLPSAHFQSSYPPWLKPLLPALLSHGHLKIQFFLEKQMRAIDVTLHQQLFSYKADRASMRQHICIYILILSNKTSFSHFLILLFRERNQAYKCSIVLTHKF